MDRDAQTVLFYAALLGLTGLIAWRSGNLALQKVTAWLALAWMVANVAYRFLGPDGEPYIAPSADGFTAVMIGALAIKHHSRAAWAVVGGYVLSAVIVVSGFAGHNQGKFLYYLLLNSAFVMRLTVVSGVGLHDLALAHRLSARGGLARRGGSRRTARS